MGKSQNLYSKAKKLIPGGTQLLSKRPEMFLPNLWPSYYKNAKGCRVQDLDNKTYIDMSYMGLGTCILGYADKDINQAVVEAIKNGNMTTLNAHEEVKLADVLCKLHPWAKMVKYARSGGEALSMAVRISRAKTGKDKVLFCGYHGWHDWYLAANLSNNKALDGHLLPGLKPNGVPRALANSAYPFNYNDTKEFLKLIDMHKKEIGTVVLESVRNTMPDKDFLQTVRQITKRLNIVLVVDEVSAGWRLTTGGAHLIFDLEPDIAVFSKGISNGFPMAAIIGKKNIMQAAQESFISSTYWTDRIGPVAAIATIKKMKDKNVPKHLKLAGKRVQSGWRELAEKNNLKINITGIYPLSHFDFLHKEAPVLKTLFTQLMLERGFLATNSFYASFAHSKRNIDSYLNAVDDVFKIINKASDLPNPAKYLKGPVCHSGFSRLT